jgi:hypothetical protein
MKNNLRLENKIKRNVKTIKINKKKTQIKIRQLKSKSNLMKTVISNGNVIQK